MINEQSKNKQVNKQMITKYNDIQRYIYISDIVPSFTTMSDVEKFMFLLTSHDLDICKVVILGVSNMYLVNHHATVF
jgi:hypothetical protein